MLLSFGNTYFDDIDGTVYEREPSSDDFYDTEDYDNVDYEYPTDLDDEDDDGGELVNITETVKNLFEKENKNV